MKRSVNYRGTAVLFGDRALLYPVNHPDKENVSNKKIATTSRVVSWVGDRIETQNTIYTPVPRTRFINGTGEQQ